MPEALRSCLHPASVPPPLPKIVGPAGLRDAYDADVIVRQKDQAAAIDCGRKLVTVIELVDAFNVVHSH